MRGRGRVLTLRGVPAPRTAPCIRPQTPIHPSVRRRHSSCFIGRNGSGRKLSSLPKGRPRGEARGAGGPGGQRECSWAPGSPSPRARCPRSAVLERQPGVPRRGGAPVSPASSGAAARHAPRGDAASPLVPAGWGWLNPGAAAPRLRAVGTRLWVRSQGSAPAPRRLPRPSQSRFQGAHPLAATWRDYVPGGVPGPEPPALRRRLPQFGTKQCLGEKTAAQSLVSQ